MHESVMAFVGRYATAMNIEGKHVLEVGSYDVNGSVRPLLEARAPVEYIGTGMRAGPGVDIALPAEKLAAHFGEESFDVVVCAEMLEHALDWRAAISNLKAVLKSDGLLLLTTRGRGFPLHDYPSDHWRFEVSDMLKIFDDMLLFEVVSDPQAPGVFVAARKLDAGVSLRGPVRLAEIEVHSMKVPA